MTKDNVKPFPSKLNPVEVKQSLQDLKTNLEALIEFLGIQARMTRAKYDALLAEGFSEEQALELSKEIF